MTLTVPAGLARAGAPPRRRVHRGSRSRRVVHTCRLVRGDRDMTGRTRGAPPVGEAPGARRCAAAGASTRRRQRAFLRRLNARSSAAAARRRSPTPPPSNSRAPPAQRTLSPAARHGHRGRDASSASTSRSTSAFEWDLAGRLRAPGACVRRRPGRGRPHRRRGSLARRMTTAAGATPSSAEHDDALEPRLELRGVGRAAVDQDVLARRLRAGRARRRRLDRPLDRVRRRRRGRDRPGRPPAPGGHP